MKKPVLNLCLAAAALTLLPVPALAQFVQQGPKLAGPGDDLRGRSVAVSADGNTAIVGSVGAAIVHTRTAGVWDPVGTRLVDPTVSTMGESVAISADGNTAIVGAPSANGQIGSVSIWIRTNGGWTQQGPSLTGSGAVGDSRQGWSVALSADGNTAIVGGPFDAASSAIFQAVGAVWIWVRNGGVWTQQGPKLVAAGVTGGFARQGWSVALSGDGNTAVVGGPQDDFQRGAAWVWTRNGGVWSHAPKLVGSEGIGLPERGSSVAVSADGTTVLVGGPSDSRGTGAAWVWVKGASAWIQQGRKLTAPDAAGVPTQGTAVSLAGDGNTALIGGSFDSDGVGAAWIWRRNGGTWSVQQPKLVGSPVGLGGTDRQSAQGRAVALSADGLTAVVGGPGSFGSSAERGGAWIFIAMPTPIMPLADIDGDSRSDLVAWRPANGRWSWLTAASGFDRAVAGGKQWGNADLGDVPLTGDIDGDSIADLVVWRQSTGTWYWLTSSRGFDYAGQGQRQWGTAGDVPFAADIDGDRRMDLLVWRPSNGTWYWLTSSTSYSYAAARSVAWGNQALGDVPLVGDFDGDRRTDLAVWRASTGIWYWLTSSTAYDAAAARATQWGSGAAGDVPRLGDFDGDGRADLVVWRPSSGTWYWLTSGSGYASAVSVVWGSGALGDVPMLGDIDGDGVADLVVWRATTGMWFCLTSTSGYAYAAQRLVPWTLM